MKTFSHGMVVVIVISEVDRVVMVECFSFFVILSRISFDWGPDFYVTRLSPLDNNVLLLLPRK